jgi:hypothetical protein
MNFKELWVKFNTDSRPRLQALKEDIWVPFLSLIGFTLLIPFRPAATGIIIVMDIILFYAMIIMMDEIKVLRVGMEQLE